MNFNEAINKLIGCLLVLFALTARSAFALTGTWIVDGSGNWGTAGNWSGGIPTLAGDTANLTFDITSARTVTINTTSRAVGTLNLADSISSYYVYTLAASGGASLTFNSNGNGATLAKTAANNNVIDVISAPVTLADNLTINNTDTTSGSGLTITGVISENGVARSITKNGAGIVRLDGANTYSGGTILNAGELQVGTVSSFNGIVGNLGPGTLTINGGTISARNGSKALTNLVVIKGDFTLNGPGAGGNSLTLAGAVDLGGGQRIVTVDATPNGAVISGPISNGGFVKAGAGPLTLSATNSYSGVTTIGGGTLFINGSMGNGAVTVNNGATLVGSGVVGGAVTVNPGGTLSIGNNSIGKLTLSNTLALSGMMVAKINRNGGSPLADLIVVADNPVNYGGTLMVDNVGASLQAGDSFTLFTGSGHHGNFSSIIGVLNAGLSYRFTNGVLSVVANAALNPTNITANFSNSMVTVSWPADHVGWRLQAQTNDLATGLSTNWSNIPGTTATNAVFIPIARSAGCVFYRQIWAPQSVVSYVDRSLAVGGKYVLRVDGKPFYMTSIQVRLDKLRYWWGWDVAARETIIAQAAADGFNTVSIPIHWYEVEPGKDNFDWGILDEYLGVINKYNLKMELLWFGQNSGGHVQWLGDPAGAPVHLRTPDYVLYSPSPSSSATTSDYTILRSASDYTLDLNDNNLKSRETYVLSRVMAHIAAWDETNGWKHPVIGVQLGNEVRGYGSVSFSSALVVSYMNGVGGAVKNSPYAVWTRLNCVYGDTNGRIDANEAARSSSGSKIDFAGIDLYGISAATVRTVLPYSGGNYRMIMESGAEITNAGQFQLAALSGNNAYDHYDMCGPDGHGLYNRSGSSGFTPNGSYIDDVRTVNKLLNADNVDIALKAHGYGLFVHNWAGNSSPATTNGLEGIVFTPNSATSQGITIIRSNTEIVLMNTKGGTFTYPTALGINAASKGYFDRNNNWIDEGSVAFTSSSISPDAGTTVRLIRPDTAEVTPAVKLQAEFANLGGGAVVESTYLGFAGNGYVNPPASGGYIQWNNVDGFGGGARNIRFRFANGDTGSRTALLTVNGVAQNVTFPPTDSWETYSLLSLTVSLNSGTNNTIRIDTTGQDAGDIDELQIL